MTEKVQTLEDWSIPMPLTATTKRIARQFAKEQPTQPKARQVYLNTLAVSTVNNYLQILGIDTDLTASGSWNPFVRLAADVADLWLTGLGSLECRLVEPGALTCHIPKEVSFDRIGYVIAQLDHQRENATLLGFSQTLTMDADELILSQLRPLQELPVYLHQCRPVVNFSRWFQGVFETGWRKVEPLFEQDRPELRFEFRKQPADVVERSKQVELGVDGETVVLMAAITPDSDLEMHLMVQVNPDPGEIYLPPNLHLFLLDEEGNVLKEAKAQDNNQTIQFVFRGELGDRFSLKIALQDFSVIEDFVV